MTGQPVMDCAVVGAGPAGLYFAILMKRQDPSHEITVFERDPAGLTYGWGVVFWDDLLAKLHDGEPQSRVVDQHPQSARTKAAHRE